jgi:hypothetical protein
MMKAVLGFRILVKLLTDLGLGARELNQIDMGQIVSLLGKGGPGDIA